nr:DUF120 domain-containing protein [Candidatus Sigynarchaeota archaeon]
MKPDVWRFLLEIAKSGAMFKPIPIGSSEMGVRLDVSQQTASRRLLQLETGGFIQRTESKVGGHVPEIMLTDKGINELKRTYDDLSAIFSELAGVMVIHGRVVSGIGEGRYYISKYLSFFQKNLDITPYSGTLNVKLLGERDVFIREHIQSQGGIHMEAFSDDTRTFGDVFAFKVNIGRGEPRTPLLPGYFLRIERTHYDKTVIEIVSPHNLRESLGLKDDDYIRIVYDPADST